MKRIQGRIALVAAWLVLLSPAVTRAQFADIPIPEAMSRLDFMVGEWSAEGAFRTPDHVGGDRTLWYVVRDGLLRFDGTAWVSYVSGESVVADSIQNLIASRAEPFAFANDLTVSRIQDGFALLFDEGSTSGSTIVYFDTDAEAWSATAFHAPTNAVTTALAPLVEGLPVFEGRGTDRRGERIFRRRYERHGEDAFTIVTDVSFDEGATWIEEQIVQEVRRRAGSSTGS